MPAVKSPASRGPVGAWARGARLAAGYKSAEAAVAALAARGWQMRADYLRGIEAGSARPGPETIHALEELYQSTAPVKPAAVTDSDAIAAAIRDQTAVIERLLTDQTAAVERRAIAVEELAKAISERLDAMSVEQEANLRVLARVLGESFLAATTARGRQSGGGAPTSPPVSGGSRGQGAPK